MNKFRNLKFISLVCIVAIFLVFIGFHFLQAQGKPDKGKPPGKGKPAPEPLRFELPNIVTTGENALSVWNFKVDDPIWSTETHGYRSVAVGDVDGDGMKEIVVPEIKEVKGKGKSGKLYYKIFLNVYKENQPGIWQTTEEYHVREDERYPVVTEVMIADVDSESDCKEIILLTDHNLAVFDYIEGKDPFTMISTTSTYIIGQESNFEAVTAGDVPSDDGTSVNRIIVSIYDSVDHLGYVCILNEDLSLYNKKILVTIIDEYNEKHTQIFFRRRSLCLAELDGDENDGREICTIGYYGYSGDECLQWKPYLIVLDWTGGEGWIQKETLLEGWVDIEESENSWPRAYLDTGDLNYNGGEEIVVSANLPPYGDTYHLILYSFSASVISNITPIQNGNKYKIIPQARIYDVEIGDVDRNGANEIVVAGRADLPGPVVFYLEVFKSNLDTLWQRIGGGKEGSVLDTAIVK